MNILNSLNEVRKNRTNFKLWEEDQNNKVAQREELNKKRGHSKQELSAAKDLGTTIIDVVDIMDQHSEDVAENVETATAVPLSIIPAAALFGTGFLSRKIISNPAGRALDELENKFFESKKVDIDNVLEKINKKGVKELAYNKMASRYNILDKRFVNRLEVPAEVKAEAKKILDAWLKESLQLRTKKQFGNILPLIIGVGTFIAGNIYATKLQVGSSKVARFQARKILEDPKYFVKYTPEQIAEAKKILESEKDSNDKDKKTHVDKLKNGMFRSIKNVLKDQKAYKEWKATDTDESQKVTRQLSQQEVNDAQKDKEIIQRTVKTINNEAEKYSQNMEVAADVIIMGTPVLGGIVGAVVAKVLTALKVIPKYVQNAVDKTNNEKVKAAYKEFAEAKPKTPGYKRKWWNFADKMMDSAMGRSVDKMSATSKAKSFVKGIIPVALSTKLGKNAVFAGAGIIVTGIVGTLMGLKLQKASARAGRYTAKQELEKNPQNFIGYSEKDFEEVKDIKGVQPTKMGKIKEYATFIPKVLKQYFAYQKYKNNELKDEKLLKDQLVKLDVSEEQMKDAKNLQRKLFNTFEKIDDKSQDYSESVEAAIEIAKPFAFVAGVLAAVSPGIYMGIQAYRGKLSAKSIVNKIVTVMSGSTKFMGSKLFKGYLKGVEKNIPFTVQNAKVNEKILKKILSGVSLKEILTKRADMTVGEVSGIISHLVENNIDEVPKLIVKLKEELGPRLLSKLGLSPEEISKMLKSEFKAESLKKLGFDSEEFNLTDFKYELSSEYLGKSDFKAKDLDVAELKKNLLKYLESYQNNNTKIIDIIGEKIGKEIGNGFDLSQMTPTNLLDSLTKFVKDTPKDELEKSIANFANNFDRFGSVRMLDLTSFNKEYIEEILPKVQKALDNIPKEEIKNILTKIVEEFDNNPDEFIETIKSNQALSLFVTPQLKKAMAVAGVGWLGANMAVSYIISSWLADMQLKAGRLGVMKAIDELKDPAYYANAEATSTDKSAKKEQNISSQTDVKQSNLLKLIKSYS